MRYTNYNLYLFLPLSTPWMLMCIFSPLDYCRFSCDSMAFLSVCDTGVLLHALVVAMTIVLEGKLDRSLSQYSQYSYEASHVCVLLLPIGFGLAGALCQATAFSCRLSSLACAPQMLIICK